jgi:Mg2+ and Co2+ transporter CorA
VGDVIYGSTTPFFQEQERLRLIALKERELPQTPSKAWKVVPMLPSAVKDLLKTEGALATYARFTVLVEENLQYVRNGIERIKDQMERINRAFGNDPKIQAILNTSNEKLAALGSSYQACLKELKSESHGNCSPFVNVIKDLQELKEALHNFRNSLENFRDCIKQSALKDTRIQGFVRELEIMIETVKTMIETADQIIDYEITPTLQVFTEHASEEWKKGTFGYQSKRAL